VNSDLPGGPAPEELGPEQLAAAEPGLEQLLSTLTSPATAGELAGEQAALTMFRANVYAVAPPRAAANGTAVAGATRPILPQPEGRQDRSTGRSRSGLWSGGWRLPRLRLAAIGGAALVAGLASAAYASVLPAPVQHAAYVAFHWAGVPDSHPGKATGSTSGGSSSATTSAHRHSHGGTGHPTPSGSTSGSRPGHGQKSGQPSGSPKPSASSSPSSGTTPAGTLALTISVPGGTQIPAGSSVTITGTLTIGGKADAGVVVRLMRWVPADLAWVRVNRAMTSATGAVSFTTANLTRNCRFRLAYATGTRSSVVVITVVPGLTTSLRLGPKGIKDYLTVSTTYAQKGDVVLLQVLQDGSWVTLQTHELTAKGVTTFAFSAVKRENAQVQAVLLATSVHAGVTSAPVTVPPPA
jgi:hypothetical protein